MLRPSHQRTRALGKSGPALGSSRCRMTPNRGLPTASRTILQQASKGAPAGSWGSGPPERRGGGKDRKQEQTLPQVGGAVPRLRNPPERSVQATRLERQTGPTDLECCQLKEILSVMQRRLRLPLSREDKRPSEKPILCPAPGGPKLIVPGPRPHARWPGDGLNHCGSAPKGPSGHPKTKPRARQPGGIQLPGGSLSSHSTANKTLGGKELQACGDLLEQKRAPSVYNGRGLGPQLGDYNALSRGDTPPAIIRDRVLDPGVRLPWPDRCADPRCDSRGLATTSASSD
ncbi:hypothetical protein Nepgr_009327 [Nepenthes gracilis]|uniref:Uncharacterized protein n=1 Tax=Nepenthes gracilis TaxID=150966 RepID=A0AAD3SB67_NEPGR|nr:hypothetical protein Nepgr_009327 [Nepenthes gracilis]